MSKQNVSIYKKRTLQNHWFTPRAKPAFLACIMLIVAWWSRPEMTDNNVPIESFSPPGQPASPPTIEATGAKEEWNADFVCLTPELDGQWVLDVNKTFADPICCDGDDKKWRKNSGLCGRERPTGDFQGQENALAFMRGRGCRCRFTDRYTWKSTAFTAWDPHDFCKVLGKREILLIGDSTMSQAATALINAVFPAKCQTQMQFKLSDTLISEDLGFLNRGDYWAEEVARHDPDIVIISSGPHIYGNGNFTRLYQTVVSDIEFLRKTVSNKTFIWKTQQPGGCTPEISPDHPFAAARQMTDLHFNWAEFFDRDSATIRIMQEHQIPFIDMRMLYSRSDAHNAESGDCLHFCSPGVLDIFPILIHRLLRTNFSVPRCINSSS